jgi:hypothetical protein
MKACRVVQASVMMHFYAICRNRTLYIHRGKAPDEGLLEWYQTDLGFRRTATHIYPPCPRLACTNGRMHNTAGNPADMEQQQ